MRRLVICAVCIVLVGCTPVEVATPSPSVAPTIVPAPSTTPRAATSPAIASPSAAPAWVELPVDATAFAGANVADVVWFDGRWVAVGVANRLPTVWTSPDGMRWTRRPSLADTNRLQVEFLAVVRSRVVAIGEEGSNVSCGDVRCLARAVVWTSTDGVAWQRVARDPKMEGFSIGKPIAWPGGLAATGFSAPPGGEGSGPQSYGTSAVWTSLDGRAWVRHNSAAFKQAYLVDVAPVGDGLAVVGQVKCHAECLGRVWFSTDGDRWATVLADDAVRAIGSVATVDSSRLVAVGTDPDDATVIWTSDDGRAWSREPGTRTYLLPSVVSVPGGVLGFGSDGVWETGDGHAWRQVLTGSDIASVIAVAPGPTGILVFGQNDDQFDPAYVAWMGPPRVIR